MGERKVLNKYYPPDFDPSNLPRNRMAPDRQMKVRMMLPMSIRCKTCGTFMYKGTKFNSRKEDVIGEDYLGIQIYRFYMRCSTCGAEMTMKTDPQNHDYVVEHGASRNYEPWREGEKAAGDSKRKRDEEEKGNAMKALENRTLDSKREMDVLSALDELRSLNKRKQDLTPEQLLSALKSSTEDGNDTADIDEEDEEAITKLFFSERKRLKVDFARIEDDDDNQRDSDPELGCKDGEQSGNMRPAARKLEVGSSIDQQGKRGLGSVPKFVIKKGSPQAPPPEQISATQPTVGNIPVPLVKELRKDGDDDSRKGEGLVNLVGYETSEEGSE